MLTVVDAAAIGRSCLAGNKVDVERGALGEYSIIELLIRVAIMTSRYNVLTQHSECSCWDNR